MSDDVRIRPAKPEEAEVLSDLAWRAKEYWDYDADEMNCFRAFLTITSALVEDNPSYLMEDRESGAIVGFYCLEKADGGVLKLEHLFVDPEYIGTGRGGELFLHACEIAETILGAKEIIIVSDATTVDFYEHMGAEKCGADDVVLEGKPFRLSLLRMAL